MRIAILGLTLALTLTWPATAERSNFPRQAVKPATAKAENNARTGGAEGATCQGTVWLRDGTRTAPRSFDRILCQRMPRWWRGASHQRP